MGLYSPIHPLTAHMNRNHFSCNPTECLCTRVPQITSTSYVLLSCTCTCTYTQVQNERIICSTETEISDGFQN